MNGGVSLAIWMSGVTRELDRLRRHEGVYGKLLDLTHATARVDVIAGASAGGLAGTLLGLAVATGSDVSSARDLWIRHGGFADMVRDPFDPDPPSLLYGDGYFLEQVRDALTNIARKEGRFPSAEPDHDLHVIVTATTLTGDRRGFKDHFGAVIRDVDHRRAFHFRKTKAPGRNDFGTDAPSLARLALAARTTSSFPGAFEPSFIPVHPGGDDLHPSMAAVADFAYDRWAIDGGVLVNTPFRRALDAIKELPAERDVRRVLVYIVASRGSSFETEDDPATAMPTLQRVLLSALSDLPRVQSFGQELAEIEDTNRRVATRRRARRELLQQLGHDELIRTAGTLLPAYVAARRESAVDDITGIVVGELAATAPTAAPAPTVDADAIRDTLPAVARQFLPPLGSELGVAPGAPWKWGIAPVEYGANVILDLLRDAGAAPELAPYRSELQPLRPRVHTELRRLRELQAAREAFWKEHTEAVQDPERAQELGAAWREAHAADAGAIAFALGGIAAEAAAVTERVAAASPAGVAAETIAHALVPRGAADRAAAAVSALLALHVVQRAAGSELAGIEQAVELVQLSANVGNPFDARERAEDKLAGMQLNHFGAFYKRSWRANDWLWGRLDGASRAVQLVLDPRRLRQRRLDGEIAGAKDAAARIVAAATSESAGAELAYLGAAWTVEELEDELAYLDDPAAEVPVRLPRCWRAVTTAIQLRIIREELPAVAAAATADTRDKCLPTARGAVWAAGFPQGELTPEQVVDQFTSCEVARETVDDEFATDYFTRLTSRVAATAGSVLHGKQSGLPKQARRLASSARGVLLALYLLARGVTAGSRIGMFLVALALASGGALLGLTLVSTPPALVPAVGAMLVLAGFALALLRGGEWVLAVGTVVVLAAVAAASYLLQRNDDWVDDLPDWVERLLPVVPILLLALLAMLLGTIRRPQPRRKPSP